MSNRPAVSPVFLMAGLSVTRSYSRPGTSNDTPYPKSHSRTAKDRPDFPDRFGSYEDADAWRSRFLPSSSRAWCRSAT